MKREADMSVLQVSLIAMVAVLLAIQLKGGRAEYGFLINLAAGIFLFFLHCGKTGSVYSGSGTDSKLSDS